MIQTPVSEQIPIRLDEDGRLRVGNTRVLLDLVIHAYWQGETPESIVDMYSTLSAEDVYLAIGYYLRHRDEIDAYVKKHDEEGRRLQQEIEANYTPEQRAFLDRLRAVRDAKRSEDA